jgi:hypothetical protein
MPADRLRRQLAALTFPIDDRARDDVRRCVDEYVDSMKNRDCPPEQVLVGLKRIAEESGIRSKALSRPESRGSRTDLVMDMVAWTIERYYASEPPGS